MSELKKNEIITKRNYMERAKIISDLLENDPTYLNEQWIIDQLINWMLVYNPDQIDHIEFFEECFLKSMRRRIGTERQQNNILRNNYIKEWINLIMEENEVSERGACDIFALKLLESGEEKWYNFDLTDGDFDLPKAIRRIYQKAKNEGENEFTWTVSVSVRELGMLSSA